MRFIKSLFIVSLSAALYLGLMTAPYFILKHFVLDEKYLELYCSLFDIAVTVGAIIVTLEQQDLGD